MRRIALIVLPLLLAISGCGSDASGENGGFYTAASIRACLLDADAVVAVLQNSPQFVEGDASGGTFHVLVDRRYTATVAFAASEAGAIETARLAQLDLESYGETGDIARHRGNVAYWRLEESNAPMRAVETCLEKTPSVRQPVETRL